MEQRFGVHEPNISPWRRAICGDLTPAFDFAKTDNNPGTLPDTSAYEPPDRDTHPSYVPKPPAVGTMPVQEAGARRTRPLPYAPYVDGATQAGKYQLTFASGNDAGAQFLITSANRTDGPWTYTTEAGKSIADTWNTTYSGGVTDLTVFGPNGFLRTFKSKPGTGLEVTARHNGTTGDLDFTLTNTSAADVIFTLTNSYDGRPKRLKVLKGRTSQYKLNIHHSKQWYDVSVLADTDSVFLRRFAGYVETGEAGVSDPAIITA
jgi:phospholipase C